MNAHREIADATKAAWEYASALLIAARLADTTRADCDAIADYHDEARDRWLWADHRARREDDRHVDVANAFSAIDFGDLFADLGCTTPFEMTEDQA